MFVGKGLKRKWWPKEREQWSSLYKLLLKENDWTVNIQLVYYILFILCLCTSSPIQNHNLARSRSYFQILHTIYTFIFIYIYIGSRCILHVVISISTAIVYRLVLIISANLKIHNFKPVLNVVTEFKPYITAAAVQFINDMFIIYIP